MKILLIIIVYFICVFLLIRFMQAINYWDKEIELMNRKEIKKWKLIIEKQKIKKA